MIMFWVSLLAVSMLLWVLLSVLFGGFDLGDRNLIEGQLRALHPPHPRSRLHNGSAERLRRFGLSRMAKL
jgi:hypothetical protein